MTHWEKDADGNLVGSIEIPMAVGLVGGAITIHPGAQANVALLGINSADDLAKVMAAMALHRTSVLFVPLLQLVYRQVT